MNGGIRRSCDLHAADRRYRRYPDGCIFARGGSGCRARLTASGASARPPRR